MAQLEQKSIVFLAKIVFEEVIESLLCQPPADKSVPCAFRVSSFKIEVFLQNSTSILSNHWSFETEEMLSVLQAAAAAAGRPLSFVSSNAPPDGKRMFTMLSSSCLNMHCRMVIYV